MIWLWPPIGCWEIAYCLYRSLVAGILFWVDFSAIALKSMELAWNSSPLWSLKIKQCPPGTSISQVKTNMRVVFFGIEEFHYRSVDATIHKKQLFWGLQRQLRLNSSLKKTSQSPYRWFLCVYFFHQPPCPTTCRLMGVSVFCVSFEAVNKCVVPQSHWLSLFSSQS